VDYRGTRVLVTGASGFIGLALARTLAEHGAEVHGLSRSPPPGGQGILWHAVDLASPGWEGTLPSAAPWTHLFHLANPSVLKLDFPLEDYLRIDVQATRSLMALARRDGAHLVTVSSGSVYAPSGNPHREEDPTLPLTPYAQAKLAGESVLTGEDRTTIVRLFGVFGPREASSRLVPTVACALRDGKEASLSEGSQVRDLLHLQDAVEALMTLGLRQADGIFNVGSGEGHSVREIAEGIARRLGRPDLLRFGPPSKRPHDCPRWVADTGRIRSALGWSPRIPWERGLDLAVAWWQQHR